MALAANLNGQAIEGLFADIKAHLHERWEVTHATLEPEVAGCGQPALLGRWQTEHAEDPDEGPGRAREDTGAAMTAALAGLVTLVVRHRLVVEGHAHIVADKKVRIPCRGKA